MGASTWNLTWRAVGAATTTRDRTIWMARITSSLGAVRRIPSKSRVPELEDSSRTWLSRWKFGPIYPKFTPFGNFCFRPFFGDFFLFFFCSVLLCFASFYSFFNLFFPFFYVTLAFNFLFLMSLFVLFQPHSPLNRPNRTSPYVQSLRGDPWKVSSNSFIFLTN